MKYACIVFILGLISALTVQGLVDMSGMQTSIDAVMFHFTIDGRDIGESFEIFSRNFFPNHANSQLFGALYLVGYNITEELVKFGFFVLAILLLKPVSTRLVLYTGMGIGAGFATIEHFSAASLLASSWYIFPVRLLGHMLFTSVIALWYSLGSFARMRWIDGGARAGLVQFLLSRWSGCVMALWVITGIFLSALFHSFVNLFASSGHYTAIIIVVIGWVGIIFFLLNQKADRPYGKILQEIKLMQHLHDIQMTLDRLQHPVVAQTLDEVPHFETKKIRLSRKQFAKK